MPLWHVTICDACGDKREFVSDTLALQLDHGTLSVLRHPIESSDCEKHGLTLYQASQRRRLFRQDYFVCRRCGGCTPVVTRVPERRPALGEQTGWFSVKLSIVVVAAGLPLALWYHRWDWTWSLVTLLVLSPLIDLNERRKERHRREQDGKPLLPTENAPGLVPVPQPPSPTPCCDAPDLIAVAQWKDTEHVLCHACGAGRLRIVQSGIA